MRIRFLTNGQNVLDDIREKKLHGNTVFLTVLCKENTLKWNHDGGSSDLRFNFKGCCLLWYLFTLLVNKAREYDPRTALHKGPEIK
jgi:hypothetical protein